VTLEKLYGTLMPLSFLAGVERTQVLVHMGLGSIFLEYNRY
jgi:hypothetical protein